MLQGTEHGIRAVRSDNFRALASRLSTFYRRMVRALTHSMIPSVDCNHWKSLDFSGNFLDVWVNEFLRHGEKSEWILELSKIKKAMFRN